MASDYELTERTYTDPDRTRIVPEDYPGGGILLGIAGDRIPAAEAERLGLTKSGAAGSEPLDQFKTMPDGPEKTALAMQLFGKQGAAPEPDTETAGDAGPEPLDVGEPEPAAETVGDAETDTGRTRDKAVRGPKEQA